MAGGFYLNFIQLTSIKVNRQKRQSCEHSFKLASASLCGKQNRHKLPTHVFQMTAVLAVPKCSVLPATCVLTSVHAVPSTGTVSFLLASMYLHDPVEVVTQARQHPQSPTTKGTPLRSQTPEPCHVWSVTLSYHCFFTVCLPTQAKVLTGRGAVCHTEPGMGSTPKNTCQMMGNGKEEIPGKWWGRGRGVMKANANIKELIQKRLHVSFQTRA